MESIFGLNFIMWDGHSGMLTNEVSWFDADENNSSQVSARLAADATTVKGAIGDRIAMIVQNVTLLLAVGVIAFSQQWKMAFVVLATFPLLVLSAFVEVITSGPSLSLYATAWSNGRGTSREVGLVTFRVAILLCNYLEFC